MILLKHVEKYQKHKREGNNGYLYLVFVNFFSWNFVREADGSRILEEFQKNSKVIWFLLSELIKNYKKNSLKNFWSRSFGYYWWNIKGTVSSFLLAFIFLFVKNSAHILWIKFLGHMNSTMKKRYLQVVLYYNLFSLENSFQLCVLYITFVSGCTTEMIIIYAKDTNKQH